jgi:hypothetical protein
MHFSEIHQRSIAQKSLKRVPSCYIVADGGAEKPTQQSK